MKPWIALCQDTFARSLKRGTFLLAVLSAAVCAQAQTPVTLFGALSNFDVLNDTKEPAYGFEIELHGVSSVGGTFNWNRFGAANIVPFQGGVYVRYLSGYDPATKQYLTATPAAVDFTPTNGHQCVLGTLNYQTSGCEHFGVWTYQNPTATYYYWLVADPANPGTLKRYGSPVSIPAPVWTVIQPAKPADPVQVAADIVAPIQPVAAFQYGDAQWMKVYKTEHKRKVGLDELVTDNAVVPEDPAQVETSWYLVQAKIGGKGKRNQKRNQGALGGGSQAVVRRYEFYKFAGTYDAITHEAICADALCNVPADAEVGNYIGAQMAAADLDGPAVVDLTVATAGSGLVTGNVGSIKCPGVCSASLNTGTSVTLTAAAAKGVVFAGWGGACQGTALTCTFTMNAATSVTASFKSSFTLSVNRAGKGVVTSAPAGIDCGGRGSCSNTFPQDAQVTLTAVPDPGSAWTGWGGACSGTALTCTVSMTKATSVQANFR
ncbi:InlB B-repeat-containing protein [Paludibaculum fermentans]|uniref:Bacterial repeat domain-containing protein n=1 Tax=Paludibaculum fermentans TaxID=1473598 RepID=A0A7S7NQ33_PALFE|nr:hypothetical protein [Paludibaculum fermentans]QOY87706.1 hypothetical protein IRI77_34005 [Paludibaculum fermentans]